MNVCVGHFKIAIIFSVCKLQSNIFKLLAMVKKKKMKEGQKKGIFYIYEVKVYIHDICWKKLAAA